MLAAVLYLAAMAWHRHQVNRNAEHLLARANQLAADRQWRQVVPMTKHYLAYRPDDIEARISMADACRLGASSRGDRQRAIEMYLDCLRRLGEHDEVRRHLAELLITMGNFGLAESQADRLLARRPRDPAALRIRAVALYGQALATGRISWSRVTSSLQQAVAANPKDIELAVGLAQLYRQQSPELTSEERADSADEVLDGLVEADRDNSRVWLARCQYRKQFNLAGADDDLEQARQLAADDPEVLLAVGEAAIQRREWGEAEPVLRRAIELAPRDRRTYLLCGEAIWGAGQTDSAIAVWRQGLQAVSTLDFALNLRLGTALVSIGQTEAADRLLATLEHVLPQLTRQLPWAESWDMAAQVDLLAAQSLVAKQRRSEAVQLLRGRLESQRRTAGQTAGVATRIRLLSELANCYLAEREADAAGRVRDEIIQLDPANPQHHFQAALAWEAAGKTTQALAAYEQAARLQPPVAAAWLGIARMELREQRTSPVEERDWTSIDEALAAAQATGEVDPAEIALVRSELASQRDNADAALAVLEQAADASPEAARLQTALITAISRQADRAEADRQWQTYEDRAGRSTDTVRLRAAMLLERGDQQEAVALVQSWLAQAPQADHTRVRYLLAQVWWKSGELKQAAALFDELARDEPQNLLLARKRAELAWDMADNDRLRSAAEQLRSIEGDEGVWHRFFEAQRLLGELASGDLAGLAQLQRHSDELSAERPGWGPALLLAGQLSEREAKFDAAIALYESALASREVSARALERLVLLLSQQGRLEEADEYLAQLMPAGATQAGASEELATMAIELAAERGQSGRALSLAEQAARSRPDDPEAQVWLARALVLNQRAAEAEAPLRSAILLRPGQPRWWRWLIEYYGQADARDRLRPLADEIAATEALPEGERRLLQGRVNQLLDEPEQAEDHFRRGLELGGTDLDLRELAGRFLLSRDRGLALVTLEKVLNVAPERLSTRGLLALALLDEPGDDGWQRAWTLASEGRREGELVSTDQLRLEARVLAARNRVAEQREAIERFEQLVARPVGVTPQDRFQLAQLYQSQGAVTTALKQYAQLAQMPSAQPDQLYAYADLLLATRETAESGELLTRLADRDPRSRRLLGLKARWLHVARRDDQIEPLLEPALREALAAQTDPRQQSETWTSFAGMYALAAQLAQAERCLRQAAQLDRRASPRLVAWLAQHDRPDEAFELGLAGGAAAIDADMATALGQALLSTEPSDDQFAQIEPAVSAALDRYPDSAELTFTVGTLRCWQQQLEQAVALFEHTLELDPRHVPALNNLAMIYAQDPNLAGSALQYIERALEAAGPRRELIDTQAVVLLKLGRIDEALDALQLVTGSLDADPLSFVHLAMAFLAADSHPQARAALYEARERGLAPHRLMPFERRSLEDVEVELERAELERSAQAQADELPPGAEAETESQPGEAP